MFRLLNVLLCLSLYTSQLSCALSIANTPSHVINGSVSNLDRPEGISFSPSGDILAIANSHGYSITLYRRVGSSGVQYEKKPFLVVQDAALLSYPHDIEFSPCGKFLAVASRDNNSLVFFPVSGNNVSSKPHAIIKGATTHLNLPASVSFHPQTHTIGVANRAGTISLTFYKKNGEGLYGSTPLKEIHYDKLLAKNLSNPHAMAFSPDGKLFGVVHKRVCANSPGKSALAIWDVERMAPIFISEHGCECLHSLSFHPTGKYVAVTNEQKDVIIFERNGDTFAHCNTIKVEKKNHFEGPKGVAFTPCGNYIAFTTMEPAILFYPIKP